MPVPSAARRGGADGPAALGAELRAPEDRRSALAAGGGADAAARHGGGEQGVELGEPLLEADELRAAVDEQVLAELVAAVHLEDEAAEVAEARLAELEEGAALAAELSWGGSARRTARAAGGGGCEAGSLSGARRKPGRRGIWPRL